MPELNGLGECKARGAAAKLPYRLHEPLADVGDTAGSKFEHSRRPWAA